MGLGKMSDNSGNDLYPHSPDVALRESLDNGFSKEWDKMFQILEEAGRPILWHVTQRVSVSPYHGGGANSYWKEGVEATNETLLQIALEMMRRYPGITLIGAHQLHVGLERIAQIFDEHPNTVMDTSCGFFVRWADELYDADRTILRDFFLKYPDRILFGTDSPLAPGTVDEYLVQVFLCHVRFVKQLRLPDDVLQKVAHGNAERLFHLDAMDTQRRGTSRP